jgi:hypothetical protein
MDVYRYSKDYFEEIGGVALCVGMKITYFLLAIRELYRVNKLDELEEIEYMALNLFANHIAMKMKDPALPPLEPNDPEVI